MKVFLSWSGERSHKVALAFRDWLPSVIQSIEPYVSSEDIDKGARWSTDIAKELEDSTYGILCVTEDNMDAPWLTFEAGALSKTMDKSFVSPFLFDVKRSEVHGPILQFQSTIFEKEDIRKLVIGLNKASEQDTLTEERLNKTFGVWYPTLEGELDKLKDAKSEIENSGKPPEKSDEESQILEEILDLSRINQKLLRSPEVVTKAELEKLQHSIDEIRERLKRPYGGVSRKRRIDPMFIEDMIYGRTKYHQGYVGFLMMLSLFRDDFPWVYEAGIDAVRELRNKSTPEEKHNIVMHFDEVVEFSFKHPVMKEMVYSKDLRMYGSKLSFILRECVEAN